MSLKAKFLKFYRESATYRFQRASAVAVPLCAIVAVILYIQGHYVYAFIWWAMCLIYTGFLVAETKALKAKREKEESDV